MPTIDLTDETAERLRERARLTGYESLESYLEALADKVVPAAERQWVPPSPEEVKAQLDKLKGSIPPERAADIYRELDEGRSEV